VLHHHGHAHGCKPTLPENTCTGPNAWYDYYNVSGFVHDELGADVLFHYMPLYPPNVVAGVPQSHAFFEPFQERGARTMRFFIEPVILSVKFALSLGYKRVLMMGKSGGG